MKKAIYILGGAILGAVLGGAVSYLYSTKQYEERMAKEIDSYKQIVGSIMANDEDETPDEPEEPEPEHDILEEDPHQKDDELYTEIAKTYGEDITMPMSDQVIDYTEFAVNQSRDYIKKAISKPVAKTDTRSPDQPYVITDEEFYDDTETTKIELFLFDDCLLTDENWDPLEEPEKVVPMDALKEFIENDDEDELFTRSDSRECLYNICKQGESWDEFVRKHPIVLEKV